jgi:uncharacterized protein with PIN domain
MENCAEFRFYEELNDTFTRCAGCGRIYWKGTHYERLLRYLVPFTPHNP